MNPSRTPSFAGTLIRNVTALVLVLGLALLLALVWLGRAGTETAARQEIGETLSRATERLQILTRAAEMTQESLERIVRDAAPTGDALQAMLEASLGAFEQRPELSYLGVALAGTGEYGCLERTADGTVQLWYFPGVRADRPRRCYVLADGRFLLKQELPANGYEPRDRPFFRDAVKAGGAGVWIPSYPWIIHGDENDPPWGFSYVKAIRDAAGRTVCVLDTDFDMATLNRFLGGLRDEYHCRLQVVEMGSVPRLIGGGEAEHAPLPPSGWLEPVLAAGAEPFVGSLDVDGERRWVAARHVALKGGVRWLVVASRPAHLIEGPLRRQLYQVIGMGLLIALALVLVSMRVARRFSRPLTALTQRVLGFGGDAAGGPVPPPAPAAGEFRETQVLDDAFSRMAAAVRQREAELSRQNGRLRSHLENTPLAVVEWDAAARITSVNAAAVALFRRDAASLVGLPVASLLAAAGQPQVAALFDPAEPAGAPRQFSAKAAAGDGSAPDCEWYVTRLDSADPAQAGGCALVLDISQLLQAKADSRAADARFSVLFSRSPAAHCLIRQRDGAVLDLNAAAEGLLEIGREESRDRPLAQLGVAVEATRPGDFRERAGQGSVRVTLRTRSGRRRHCLLAVAPVAVDREACELWVAIDITAEVIALEQRAALEARITRQRDALIGHTEQRDGHEEPDAILQRVAASSAATLAAARVSIWIYNSEQTRLHCRDLFDAPAGTHTAGQELSAGDYPNYFRTLARSEIMAVDDAIADPRTQDFKAAYLEPLGIGAMLDVPLHVGGKIVGVLCHEHVGGPRAWTDDEKAFAVAMANLASLALEGEERRLLQEQFLRAQRMEAIGTLAGGLAHDLNNILAPMVMAAALLKVRRTTPEDLRLVAMIESSAQRGSGIIRQLLSLGRPVEEARTSVQLRHLIRDLAHLIQETFPRDIAFAHAVPANLWAVPGDPTQLHQVLLNLCVNARDAMPRGGQLRIEAANAPLAEGDAALTSSIRPGPFVRLVVSDTGEGIPEAIVNRIFDPFFTTKPPGKGTGLGLSSVLGIVRRHGGFLKVASTPGAGTSFEIFLPAEEAGGPAEGPEATAAAPRGDGELVLVVDDEASLLQTTREVLELNGYPVVTAENGVVALQRFIERRGAVRLVVTDIAMPSMSGLELVRSLLILEKALRFVVLSGSAHAEQQAELRQIGIRHILDKPCEAAALLRAVHAALAE